MSGRRNFAAFAVALALVALPGADAGAQNFTEGTHYTRINPPMKTGTPGGKIEVREFFWYGCPHCYSFEPYILKWKKQAPADVVVIQTPAVLGERWVAHAYTYYTLDELGVLDKLHPVFFAALHKDKKRLTTLDEIADFFTLHGIEKSHFVNVYKSFSVNNRVKKAEDLGLRAQVKGVPFVTVAGRYAVVLGSLNSFQQLTDLLDHLVAKERAAMKS